MNAGLRALKKVSPEAYENITGKQAMGGMKHKIMMALGGMTDEQVSQVAGMGMKAVKDYGMGGKTYEMGGITERNAGIFRGSEEKNLYDEFGNIVGTEKETSKLRSLLGADKVMYDNDGNKIAKVNEKRNKTKVTFYDEGGLNGDGETKPGVMTQIDNRFEQVLEENGIKSDLTNKVMNSISQGRIGERNKEKAMKEFGWDGSAESLATMPAHKIADIFKTTTQGPNINMYEILARSANDVGADWNPQQNQLYTTIHHSGARNLSPDQLDPLFDKAGWSAAENSEITNNFIQQAVAGNVNFMGGEATGNRGRGMAYEMDTARLGQGFQGRDYTFGKSEFDNQEGVFESGESDAIRFEFENAIETPQAFASKGALKDGTFNLNTVLNRREFVPTDNPTPPPTRQPEPPMATIPPRGPYQIPYEVNPQIIPPGRMTVTKRDPLPPSGLGRQPIYVASDFLPGAAGVDERGRMREESDTFTSSLGFPDPTVQPLNLEALRALQRKRGGRIYKFGGKY